MLGVQGQVFNVPIVEGNVDVKKRWTANLSTTDDEDAILKGEIPFCEMMFKAEADGRVCERVQEYIRSRGFPKWFSVTTAPKGSYREQDVITFLKRHLEEWRPGRDWRILLADDFSAHKTANVRRLCWSRGYILLIHGGGATPTSQTPDTDLNEHVRREYSKEESVLLLEKMRDGVVVPKASPEECCEIMRRVLSNPLLHVAAAKGYKKVGQSIDVWGSEDNQVCREAGVFWNERTTDGFANMRQKMDRELAAVAGEAAEMPMNQRSMDRLITPYPKRKEADKILEALGEDFSHDAIHDDTPENKGDSDGETASEDEPVENASEQPGDHVHAAVAGDEVENADGEGDADIGAVALTAEQSEEMQAVHMKVAALQEALGALKSVGAVKAMRGLEVELKDERRRERTLSQTDPNVAQAFQRRRQLEDQATARKRALAQQLNDTLQATARAEKERKTAVAALKKQKQAILDFEALCEVKHAMKTFTADSLGQGSANAGGPACRKRRLEVLERMARGGSGLSPGQKNDWAWFCAAWDNAMVAEHKDHWGKLFAEWMQGVLDSGEGNAFSKFVYNETRRVFKDVVALHVP